MTAAELLEGKPYVLSGLQENPKNPHSKRIGSRIGLLVKQLAGGRLLVRLRMAGVRKWAPKARVCSSAAAVRLASEREVILGFPVDATTTAVLS